MEEGKEREGVTVFFFNAQSVVRKMDELRAIATSEKPDIIAITETWANESIGDAHLKIDGYEIIGREDRRDTMGGRGGGIIIHAVKSLHVWKMEVSSNFNQMAVVTMRCGSAEIKLHVIYRSPNSNELNDMHLCEYVGGLRGTNVLIGDFNMPDIDWGNGMSGSRGRKFFEAATEKSLEQHVEEATHISGNKLDLILADKEGLIGDVKMLGRVGRSDHELIAFQIKVEKKNNGRASPRRNFRRAKYEEMKTELRKINWASSLNGKTVNEIWEAIQNKLNELIRRYVPLQKTSQKNDPQWMDSEIKKLIKKKREAWKKWKQRGTENLREEYKNCEKEVKNKILKKKNKVERDIVKYRTSNPKMFYRFINNARTTRSKVGPLKNDKGEIVIDPKEQAEMLNSYLASVFTRMDCPPPSLEREKEECGMDEVQMTEEKVKSVIENLDENAAAGPDGIPPFLVKQLKDELIEPLTTLFQASIEQSRIPDEWRLAVVTPIYKNKGKKSDPCNYRPVSLTSVIGKVMERVVKEQLTTYLEKNGLISDAQHGFRHGRSPQTNLIEFLNETTKWLDKGRSFDILYLDFEKAFDKVCHERLLTKLEAKGIGGKAKAWLKDWLRGRKQQVRVDGETSGWIEVVSSVIQGSVLGGTLFTVFVDDLVRIILEALIKLFADDTKVAQIVETEEDVQKMQSVIDELARWTKEWGMNFNVKKCKIMHVGSRNKKHKYTMDGEELAAVTEEKDLGVWLEASHKPTKQCAAAAKAAHFALGQIQRSFHYRKKENLVPLWKTFVRPRLEFAVAAWSPWQEGDIKSLEKVQERLVRMLSDVRGSTYEERVADAGLTTLKERRVRGDAIETFKSLNGFNRVKKENWFQLTPEGARDTRRTASVTEEGVQKKTAIEQEQSRLEVRRNFFNVRVVKEWNRIPDEVKRQKSVNAFKTAYDRWRNPKKPKPAHRIPNQAYPQATEMAL